MMLLRRLDRAFDGHDVLIYLRSIPNGILTDLDPRFELFCALWLYGHVQDAADREKPSILTSKFQFSFVLTACRCFAAAFS